MCSLDVHVWRPLLIALMMPHAFLKDISAQSLTSVLLAVAIATHHKHKFQPASCYKYIYFSNRNKPLVTKEKQNSEKAERERGGLHR